LRHARAPAVGNSPAAAARPTWEPRLPKRNYGYEKRQKELHKQQKREEKLKRKLERADAPADQPEGDESETPAPE
jgi:hypothetical protein